MKACVHVGKTWKSLGLRHGPSAHANGWGRRFSTVGDADDMAVAQPNIASKPLIDVKHIRENAGLYAQNCIDRNYGRQSTYPAQIVSLFSQWKTLQSSSKSLREDAKKARRALQSPSGSGGAVDVSMMSMSRDAILETAKALKQELQSVEAKEEALMDKIQSLAVALPNLTSEDTPRGDEATVLSFINDAPPDTKPWKSHVDIGTDLGILDFAAAGTASGWGWYYLVDEAAQLEQALVQYALAVATKHGWSQVSPPTMVYSHIASACGFRPRDQSDERQIYAIAQDPSDQARGKPEHCLVGTSEISLAAMKAHSTIPLKALPAKKVAASRCYRAEAGARGVDTKGLYRVHEFTKVELFAWTAPNWEDAQDVFDEILDMQTEILGSLGLYCRILEMPSTDLGASAARKCDIEAFFPSRRQRHGGWGELSSTSICTDYQTRRLGTRVKVDGGKMGFPWTVNGTALAVPRVIAAILENGWNEDGTVHIPECLSPWMGGKDIIGCRKGAM